MSEILKEKTKTESITVDIYNWLISQGLEQIPVDQMKEVFLGYLSLINLSFNKQQVNKLLDEQVKSYKKAKVDNFTAGALETGLARIYEKFHYPMLRTFYYKWREL